MLQVLLLFVFINKNYQESKQPKKADYYTGQTKLCHHHPPPAKLYRPHPPPATTTHYQPKYIHYLHPKYIHHHPPPAKIYSPPFTTTHRQPKLYKKPIYKNLQPLPDGNVRNLNSRPAINCKETFFYMALSIIFTTYTRNGFKKLQCERTFILCETSLVLKKDKCLKGWLHTTIY